jgi:predicted ribosome-associated RNA-binding protein Tma20
MHLPLLAQLRLLERFQLLVLRQLNLRLLQHYVEHEVLELLAAHVQLLLLGGTPLFFSTRDGGWFPTLRLLHQYPDMMPRLRTDK